MSKLKLESLLIAFGTYFMIIVAIIIALYQHNTTPIKAKNYTEKKSEVIEVSLGTPASIQKKISKKKKENSQKKKEKIQKKKKKKVIKKIRNNKIQKKEQKTTKYTKKKKSKKTPSKKKSQIAKADANKLFKSIGKIKTQKKSETQKGNRGKSLNKSNKEKGIENRYFAKIQNTLKGWPAQSNFAGEKIRVELIVYQSGLFDYKILYKSLNPEFNEALKSYLEQLRRVGFGMHSNPKPYRIIVEFIAK